jgi:alpha-1,2-mannosyltransferase
MTPTNPVCQRSRTSERLFVGLLLAVFAAVSIQYTIKTLDLRAGKQDRSAILRWREQLLRLDGGENIYAQFNYPNPPIMALLLRPLADLPPLAGALVWYYLKVGMTLAAFTMSFRLAEKPGRPFPPWAKGLAVVLSIRPILGDLTHGNVNLFILFLVVAALAAFRHGRDGPAGVLLALAIACKVTPALFVPYFLWKRAWRVLAGVGIGLVLFFFVIPGAVLGWDANAALLGTWVNQMVTPFLVGGVVTSEHQNQSLPGLVHRLLTASPSFITYVNDVYTPTEYHNLLALGPRAAGWVIKGSMAAFAGLTEWCCRTPARPRASAALAAEYALVVLGMLLFSERTWKHHGVTLVLPFAVLCYALSAHWPKQRTRTFVIGALIVAQVALSTTSTGLMPDEWAKLAQVYGAYTWAFMFLAAAVVVVLRRGATASAVAIRPAAISRAA